jgi:DNA primase
MLPREYIDEVTARSGDGIVDLIGQYVALKKAGGSWIGMCPFHAEKTGSFFVTPSRRRFKCFGCQASGDAIEFMMKHEGMTFTQAVNVLGERFGVQKPEELRRADVAKLGVKGYVEARAKNGAARKNSPSREAKTEEIKEGRPTCIPFDPIKKGATIPFAIASYLKKRRLSVEVAERYGIGYVLHYERISGDKKQVFKDRLVLPVFYHGLIVYFQARAVTPGVPKFKNPANTLKTMPVYQVEAAGKKGKAVLVEGIFDSIAVTEATQGEWVGICCFGKFPSEAQFILMAKHGITEIILLPDRDVVDKDKNWTEYLEGVVKVAQRFIGRVRAATLTAKDAWESEPAEIRRVVEEAPSADVFAMHVRMREFK